MTSAQAQKRRRAEQVGRREGAAELAAKLREHPCRADRAGAAHRDADKMAKRRIAELAPALELAREELLHVVSGSEHDRARVRLEGLDEHPPRRVAAASPGELRHELKRALLRPEVGKPQPCVGIDDGGERDASEVVSLRHHLRPEKDAPLAGGETGQRLAQLPGPAGHVRVEPEQLQLREPGGELRFELLRSGTESRDLGGPTGRAQGGRGRAAPAVVAVQTIVGVEGERDVAIGAPEGQPARTAVERRRDPASVQQQDRLAAPVREPPELREERRGERVARFPPEIDDLHGRERAREASAQLEALERLPALRPGRGAPEDRDGPFQRGALRGDRAGVVARVRLLLVGGVVFLVDADQAERGDRSEDRGARPDDDRRLPGGDSLALVAPLGLGQGRVQNGHSLAEAGAEAAERLRGERDLGNEDDCPAPARERVLAAPEVDLGLAAPSSAEEQEGASPTRVQRFTDPLERDRLGLARLGGGVLPWKIVRTLPTPGSVAARTRRGSDEAERPRRSRPVVLGHPEREVDEGRGHCAEHVVDGDRLDIRRRGVLEPDDHPAALRPPEAHGDDGALLQAAGEVRKRPRDGASRDERHDGGKAGHDKIIPDMAAGHSVDDYLETIYFLAFPIGEYKPDTKGAPTLAVRVADMLGVSRASAGEMLKRLEAEGLVERGEHKEAILTAQGREVAERVVRKHRIIERLLTDFMGYTAAEAHVQADMLGNTFTDDMVERIAKQLGMPERCPHGWPVDVNFEQAENRELKPLNELTEGESAEIVRLAEHDGELLHWYYDEGLVPGTQIELRRAEPAAGQFALTVDGDERAIGERAAAGLFVRPAAAV